MTKLSHALGLLAFVAASAPLPARADDWWGPDKALHFGVSAGIAGAAYGVSATVIEPRWGRAVAGASVALAAGGIKELVDLTGAGDPSWKDFTWDVLGTAVGVGIALAIDFAVRPSDSKGLAAAPNGVVVRF
jgi:putative lipoprotein